MEQKLLWVLLSSSDFVQFFSFFEKFFELLWTPELLGLPIFPTEFLHKVFFSIVRYLDLVVCDNCVLHFIHEVEFNGIFGRVVKLYQLLFILLHRFRPVEWVPFLRFCIYWRFLPKTKDWKCHSSRKDTEEVCSLEKISPRSFNRLSNYFFILNYV